MHSAATAPISPGPQDWLARRVASWNALDRIVALYTCLVGALILVRWQYIAEPAQLIATHVGILILLIALPPRGTAWERRTPGEGILWRVTRILLRFLRYTYPLLFALFFFEEGQQTIPSVWVESPFWFEDWLYAAERAVYGELPVLSFLKYKSRPLDELMHFFYFSYYPIVVFGTIFAFLGPRLQGCPEPGFDTVITACITSYLLAFVWYPYLPARGPWENPELMAGLPEFRGPVFVPTIKRIISEGGVNGGCFPSGHAAGTWGAVFGLARRYRLLAYALTPIALGMSVSCVYTRYHHSVDIVAGFLAAVAGGWIAWKVTKLSD